MSYHLLQNIPQRFSANSSDTFLVIFFSNLHLPLDDNFRPLLISH